MKMVVFMGKTFEDELKKAYQKRYKDSLDFEIRRVHQTTVRDTQHAFRDVNIPKPDPWRQLWK